MRQRGEAPHGPSPPAANGNAARVGTAHPLRRAVTQQAATTNRLFTVGHSTRSLDELIELLQEHGIDQLVDVRHFPRSRRNPQVNQEILSRELPARGIAYFWEGETLGGFRPGGYEAYMTAPAFAKGIARLEQLVNQGPSAIMCAEIVWFRCHRRFIAREMAARGYRVTHIVNLGKPGYEERLPADNIQPTIRAE